MGVSTRKAFLVPDEEWYSHIQRGCRNSTFHFFLVCFLTPQPPCGLLAVETGWQEPETLRKGNWLGGFCSQESGADPWCPILSPPTTWPEVVGGVCLAREPEKGWPRESTSSGDIVEGRSSGRWPLRLLWPPGLPLKLWIHGSDLN